MQVSGNDGVAGWARKDNLKITSDKYSYSFDYKNIDTPNAADESNCFYMLASFNHGSLMPELIKHNASSIVINLNGKKTAISNDLKNRTRFDINVNGNTVEIFIDGVSSFTGTLDDTSVKPTQIGWIGDGDATGSYWDGSGLFDNIVVTDNDNVVFEENFDTKTVSELIKNGWSFSPSEAMAISHMDASDKDGLYSLSIEALQSLVTSGITINASELIKATGKMRDGSIVPNEKMNVTYTSSNEDVLSIMEQNGVPVLSFNAPGNAPFSVFCITI